MDEERERLEAKYTPEQLEAYDELRAKFKRELTDGISASLGGALKGFGLSDDFAHDFDEGFRDAVATGRATKAFEESMEEKTDGEGNEAPAAEEEGQV